MNAKINNSRSFVTVKDDPFITGQAFGTCVAGDVGIPDDMLRELIGHKELPADSPIAASLRNAKEEALLSAKPRFSLFVHQVEVFENGALVGGVSFNSETLKHALLAAERAIVVLTTIGRDIVDRLAIYEAKKDVLAAYLLDAVASVIVEKFTDIVHQEVGRYAAGHGLYAGHRYSPGYCDWDIWEQEKMFSLLEANTLDVILRPSMLMDPKKSISAVFGVSSDRQEIAAPACLRCAEKDCPNRRNKPFDIPKRDI